MRAPVTGWTVRAAVEDAHRREWAFVLAATVRVTRDLDLAQECAQDAFERALERWPVDGVPTSPGAWLTTVARRRALDALRHQDVLRRRLPLLVLDAEAAGAGGEAADPADGVAARLDDDSGTAALPDDRLRLIFTCCHPALAPEAQIALTLRLVCGVPTPDVARAFLVSEPTMAARITRAKRKIAAARIPYRVPGRAELPERTEAVLAVVHLLFTVGHTAPSGELLYRDELIERAIGLARMVRGLLPDDGEAAGLLALMLLTDARRGARMADGRMLLLQDQDRSRWDRALIEEGDKLVRFALRSGVAGGRRAPGRFGLQAAIAGVHAQAPAWADTDWFQIIGLYDVLLRIWPSPVVALNRAVAVGMARGPLSGLREVDALADQPALAAYPYAAAARADFLRQLGRSEEARAAYGEALLLTDNAIERDFLQRRVDDLR